MTATLLRKLHGTKGQGLVEFALIFPVLVIVLIAVFDLGRLVFAYNGITNAAREATRTGIVDQTIATIQTDAIDQAVSLGLTASAVDVKFCKPDATACSTTKPTTLDSIVQVQITYSWRAITPVIGNIVGPVTVTSVSRMPIERLFP
jgi:Flp pilus assembly protein TadG